MPIMSLDEILDRVQELKAESAEKDEVIRVQQIQIDELEGKIRELEARCAEMRGEAETLADSARKSEEMLEKISQMLG